MKGRIYIAGPMTGYEDYNFPAFNRAAERLHAVGWLRVINPVDIVNRWGGAAAYETHAHVREQVRADEHNALNNVDAIYLLQGWEKSRGTRCELLHILRQTNDPASPEHVQIITEDAETREEAESRAVMKIIHAIATAALEKSRGAK